jgi:hypothetical protein
MLPLSWLTTLALSFALQFRAQRQCLRTGAKCCEAERDIRPRAEFGAFAISRLPSQTGGRLSSFASEIREKYDCRMKAEPSSVSPLWQRATIVSDNPVADCDLALRAKSGRGRI